MSVIGRYTALAKVADGGMAEIFLAVQHGAHAFERQVILKRVRAEVAQDSMLMQALRDEARIAMGLTHSNIAQVLDVGEAAGRTFLVLELVDGWSLAQLIRRARQQGERVPWALSLFVGAQLCRALAYAHGYARNGAPMHIVHRDLSPQNVLVSAEGEVKLSDFGIARAEKRETQTQAGIVKGKPEYMSPEQARGEPLDGRSDLFALGAMLYELVTGERPFKGATDYEVLVKVQAAIFEPPRAKLPAVPVDVEALIMRAMAPKVDARFESAQVMLVELERLLRTRFGSAGQTELKTWLAELRQKDGQGPISTKVPAVPSPATESGELLVDVELRTAPSNEQPAPAVAPPAVPPPPPPGSNSFAAGSAAQPASGPLISATLAPPTPAAAALPPAPPAPGRSVGGVALAVLLLAGVVAAAIAAREPLARFLRGPAPNTGPTPAQAVTPPEPSLPVASDDAGAPPEPDAGVAEVSAAPTPDAAVEPAAVDQADAPEAADAGDLEAVMPDAAIGSAADALAEAPSPVEDAGPAPTTPAAHPPVAVATPRDAGSLEAFRSVRIVSVPAGAAVRVERTTFGVAPISIRFRAGLTFEVVLSLKGYEEARRQFTVRPWAGQTVTVELQKKGAKAR